jgi:hypothetical protein
VSRARPIAAAALLAVAISAPAGVSARPRPRFEPTDLEWEDTGVAEVDVELGLIRGPSTGRLMVPDFELDIGILDNVELNLDGAFALESHTRCGRRSRSASTTISTTRPDARRRSASRSGPRSRSPAARTAWAAKASSCSAAARRA